MPYKWVIIGKLYTLTIVEKLEDERNEHLRRIPSWIVSYGQNLGISSG
jgi:hypothetical protein